MAPRRVTADSPPTPLNDCIREHLEDQGISIRTLALRSMSQSTGQRLTAQWITDVLSGRVPRMPDMWRLEALAAGLGMDADSLKGLAITQWIGWEIVDVPAGVGERLIFRAPRGYTAEQCTQLADELIKAIGSAHTSTQRDEA
ncbi:hypothetical protein GCM10009530_42100 [Microbispora corallina]|uniref:XRE family transcriptional regulator n=2 Tax=Microbispora corallina TaxID=83302 RepID=A0ABQ4G1B2_9ACTN|nr:hypothetical protein Mco01_38610 [Microbispora corallina]